MKAIIFNHYGGREVIKYVEQPLPKPKRQQVIVRVRAASVNPLDWKIRNGEFSFLTRWWLPKGLGCDFAGDVIETGAGATQFKVGDAVIGSLNPMGTRQGAFAEYVAVSQNYLTHKPSHLSYEASAALPIAGLSALQSVKRLAKLGAAKRVLIIGASGGVGHMAVQVAKAVGAHVSAVCGPKNASFVKDLGADDVVDYTTTDLATLPKESFDAILDFMSAHRFGNMRHLLRRGGRYVYTLATLSALLWSFLGLFTTKRVRILTVDPRADDARELVKLAESGQLTPHIENTFALAQAADALALSEAGHTRGKLIIQVSTESPHQPLGA